MSFSAGADPLFADDRSPDASGRSGSEDPVRYLKMNDTISGLIAYIRLARSMIFKDDGLTLEKYLDVPWCKADPYYIHKLALTARAYAQGR